MTDTQREVTDDEGTVWTCVQAYAGMGESAASHALEEKREAEGRGMPVVCTPRGGERTARLELPPDWMTALDDAALVTRIRAALEKPAD